MGGTPLRRRAADACHRPGHGGKDGAYAFGRALSGTGAHRDQKEIFEAVLKIREEGTTILFVEQNSKIALNTADRGYVMQTGEIIMEDTCANLLQNEEVKKAYLGGS